MLHSQVIRIINEEHDPALRLLSGLAPTRLLGGCLQQALWPLAAYVAEPLLALLHPLVEHPVHLVKSLVDVVLHQSHEAVMRIVLVKHIGLPRLATLEEAILCCGGLFADRGQRLDDPAAFEGGWCFLLLWQGLAHRKASLPPFIKALSLNHVHTLSGERFSLRISLQYPSGLLSARDDLKLGNVLFLNCHVVICLLSSDPELATSSGAFTRINR